MDFQKLTIRTRLLILTLVLIIPFTLLGFFNLWDFWETNWKNLDESLEQQAKLASKAFEQHLLAQRQPLIMLSALMAKKEDKFTTQDYIDSVVKTRADWLDLQVLDQKGKSIFKQNVKKTDLKKNSAEQVKDEADRENKFTVESNDSNDGKKTLSLAMPLSAENVAVAQIDGISIRQIFENLKLPNENLIIVIDKNNHLIYNNKEVPEDFKHSEAVNSIFSQFKASGDKTIEIKSSYDKISRVYGISKIEMADAVVAVGKPTASLYEPARQKFARNAAISIILIMLGIAFAFFITRGIIRPMKHLTEVVRRFGKGETSVRVKDLPDGTIGELGSTFNKMAGEITERHNELEELNRLKSNFVDSVSHELRTPLTTIKSLTHVLRSGNVSNSERKEYLATIAAECNRQIEFVQTMLNLSRIESGAYKIRLEPKDITESVRKCIETHKKTAETRNLSLIFKSPTENPPLARTDNEALCLVISSLIENALKYTPAGGEINLSAELQDKRIAVIVSDNGNGIANEDIPQIFGKFYRGRPLKNIRSDLAEDAEISNDKESVDETFGIGLGLYLVNNLVKELKGKISVESPAKNSNKGTTFTLLLPTVLEMKESNNQN